MADNLTTTTTVSTIASGTVVGTDDCAGVHIQKVKLIDGTADSTAIIPGDATNGLFVNVKALIALPAGTNAIGKLAANSGIDIGDVDVTSVVPGTAATNLGKAEDAGHTSGDTGVMALAVRHDTLAALATTDLDYSPLQVDATGNLYCTLGTMPQVIGPVAHDAADAQAPVKTASKAKSALSGITLVADADVTDNYADLDGVQISRSVCLGDVVQERTTNTDGASTAFASGLAAPASGIRLWITNVDICNSSASFCTVDLRDGSAGSVLWTLPVPATSGVVKSFNPPLKLTAATALAFDASAGTTTLTISANGFKSKV